MPRVYIKKIQALPNTIVSVETAIPAFIGYTEKAQLNEEGDLNNKPRRIESMLEYEQYFGYPDSEKDSLKVVFDNVGGRNEVRGEVDEARRSKFLMHYSLQLFFANGGGPCWITSVGNYLDTGGLIRAQDLSDGLKTVAEIDEVTLLVLPDSINLSSLDAYCDIYAGAIQQCADLKDRFTVLDVYQDAAHLDAWNNLDVQAFRNRLGGAASLKYAAVYFPRIYTGIKYNYKISGDQRTDDNGLVNVEGIDGVMTLSDLKSVNEVQYFQAQEAVSSIQMLVPVSAAIVGVYAQVDKARGVWKAPANINITNATRPQYSITDAEQEGLNVDVSGKSINAIRSFVGRGAAIVWGARTLGGNDVEWRYVPVVRYCNMILESVKKGIEKFATEPNDPATWIKLKAMVENYLVQQWRAGALIGNKPEQAFYVRIGLGQSMTELDILEGRMIVQIGLAVVRPAEFLILKPVILSKKAS